MSINDMIKSRLFAKEVKRKLPYGLQVWLDEIELEKPMKHEVAYQKANKKHSGFRIDPDLVEQLGTPIYLDKKMTFDERYVYLTEMVDFMEYEARMFFKDYDDYAPMFVARSHGKNVFQLLKGNIHQLGLGDDAAFEAYADTLEVIINRIGDKRVLESIDIFEKWLYDISASIIPTNSFMNDICTEQLREDLVQLKRKKDGREKLKAELALLDNRFTVLENVSLHEDDEHGLVDFIIVSPYGVYALDAKHFVHKYHDLYSLERNGIWHYIPNNNTMSPMREMNGESQSMRPQLLTQRIVNAALTEKELLDDNEFIDVHGLVVLTNIEATYDNNSEFEITNMNGLFTRLHERENTLSKAQIDKIIETLSEFENVGETYAVRDYLKEMKLHLAHLEVKLKAYNELKQYLGLL